MIEEVSLMLAICCLLSEYHSTKEGCGEIFKEWVCFAAFFQQYLYVLFVLDVVALMFDLKARIFTHLYIDYHYFFGKSFTVDGESDVLLTRLSHFIAFLFQLLQIRLFCKSSPSQQASLRLDGVSFQVAALPPLLPRCLLSPVHELSDAARTSKLVLGAELEEFLVAILPVEGEAIMGDAKRRGHGIFLGSI